MYYPVPDLKRKAVMNFAIARVSCEYGAGGSGVFSEMPIPVHTCLLNKDVSNTGVNSR